MPRATPPATPPALSPPRRGFLRRLAGWTGLSAAAAQAQPRATTTAVPGGADSFLPRYARALNYRSLKQSSFDRTEATRIAGPSRRARPWNLFRPDGPGVVTHLWFTISAQSANHLKEIVIRAYWDGNPKPSVEVPVGDLFGLNLGQYVVYQSAYLNCSSIKALNCYFAMPFRRSARITATNEGSSRVGSSIQTSITN